MPRLDFKTRETAQGKVAEFFSMIPQTLDIPAPFTLLSASPGLFGAQMNILGYFRSHSRLEPAFLACVRMCSAHRLGFKSCVDFNRRLLGLLGLKPAEIEAALADPSRAPFEEPERALLAFALKAALEPEAVADAEIEGLRGLGFQDSDILDACFQAANLIGPGRLAKAFGV